MIVYDIQDLVKIYPGQHTGTGNILANDHINLQIHQGEIFGLLGDNGAGKTTLVRQMANLIPSTSGSINLYNQPVQNDPMSVALLVGYMPQGGQPLNNLTVGEALYYTAHLRGLSALQARAERNRLAELWELSPLMNRPNNKLSGGQKRLLQIATAMAGSPPVLILDEPTNDLDPQRRNHVWQVLRELNHQQGITIIFITHDAIEAEKIIQRIGIMRQGKLVAVGNPSDLKKMVDQKLRLEIFASPASPPVLPDTLEMLYINHGRWLAYIERAQAAMILNQLDMSQVDDFRLYSATLEDLYLYYANHS